MRDPWATYPPRLRAYLEDHAKYPNAADIGPDGVPFLGPKFPRGMVRASRKPTYYGDARKGSWVCIKPGCNNVNPNERAGCAKCGSSNHGYLPSVLPRRPW